MSDAVRVDDATRLDDLLARARAAIAPRVAPAELSRLAAQNALIVDIRPADQRDRDGAVPGAVVVDRNVLEWRLAPTSDWQIREAQIAIAAGAPVVIVCNEGYQSSLAAATLRELGVTTATDLAGGFQAWVARVTSDPAES